MPSPTSRSTRRQFFAVATIPPLMTMGDASEVIVPVHHVIDGRKHWRPRQLDWYWSRLWPQAQADLRKCGIRLHATQTMGEVWRPPEREPEIEGLARGALNIVVTHTIPMFWDRGRALSGVTTRYHGTHVCMIALHRAHLHEAPLLSVNTCVHELLHAILGDVFESRPAGLMGELRELRIDYLATRLWLFHDGGVIRQAAQRYLQRLRPPVAASV